MATFHYIDHYKFFMPEIENVIFNWKTFRGGFQCSISKNYQLFHYTICHYPLRKNMINFYYSFIPIENRNFINKLRKCLFVVSFKTSVPKITLLSYPISYAPISGFDIHIKPWRIYLATWLRKNGGVFFTATGERDRWLDVPFVQIVPV